MSKYRSTSLDLVSGNGGTQKLAIASNVAVGTAQPCRSCLVTVPSGNTGRIYLTIANEAADTSDFLLPEDEAIPIPIDDVSRLHFYGDTNADVIYILWRN